MQISDEVSGRTPEVTEALRDEFGISGEPEVSEIGPTFGESVANSALVAIIASLSVISIYIALRFEWKFAVPVLIALMHDILITAGIYALVGREVTTSTVAALLTILGFSLYDTIIVFDRIRENVPRMPSAAFSQIVNRSMSEVIVRSLATSFCTALPVIALFLFGGETLKDFAFALLIGTLSGTYSSVFIAGPVLVHWKEREPVYRARYRRIREALGSVPAYAVATAGAPVDVEPGSAAAARPRSPRRRTRRRSRATSSTTWCATSASTRQRRDAQARRRPRPGARREAGARARAATAATRRGRARPAQGDARPRTAPGGPTSRRSRATAATGGLADGRARVGHGRPRALALHDLHSRPLLVGIVGAFLGALLGSVLFGVAIHGFSVPGQDDTDLRDRARGDPRRADRHRRRLLLRRQQGNEPV